MENDKYSNICVNYEKIIKKECEMVTDLNEYHCKQVQKLLEECYKFKEKKTS